MKRQLTHLGVLAIPWIALTTGLRADEPTTAPQEKSGFTIFTPTPANALRGMDTDRPNITNTPHTIDAGHYQLEAGILDYSIFRHQNTHEDNYAFGQFNLRAGVLNNLELNVAITAYENDRTRELPSTLSSRADGFGDAVFGGKLNIWGNEGGDDAWTTALAIQPQLKFPTASHNLGNDRFESTVGVPFLMNLPGDFHFSAQEQFAYERNSTNSGYVAGFHSAVSIDREFANKLDIYLEYADDITTEKHVLPVQTIDVGAIYQVNDNFSVDTGLSFGLNKVSNNFELVVGFSYRI